MGEGGGLKRIMCVLAYRACPYLPCIVLFCILLESHSNYCEQASTHVVQSHIVTD